MTNLIARLEKANDQLTGTAESHAAIAEAIEVIKYADRICESFLPVMEAARPLVLHLEQLKDYAKVRGTHHGS